MTAIAFALSTWTLDPDSVANFRYGRIVIAGNVDTPDHVILAQLDFRPGQKGSFAAIREAQQRLQTCGTFNANPWCGIGPTVKLVPSELDSTFLDVLVTVEERPGNWLVFGISELASAILCLNVNVAWEELERLLQRATSGQ